MSADEPALVDASPPRAAGGRPKAWLVTFTDLVALMLAFFVMLFSMGTLDETKWRLFTAALSDDQASVEGAAAPTAPRNIAAAAPERGRDLDYLATLLVRRLSAEPRLAGAVLQRRADRVVIALPDGLLFAPDGSTPRADAEGMLFALAGILRNLPNRIAVEGHSDPDPPDPGRFASNWELSLRRAAAVARGLERAGYAKPVVVRGYGESRFEALSPRLDATMRHALARRVDIVIHDSTGAAP